MPRDNQGETAPNAAPIKHTHVQPAGLDAMPANVEPATPPRKNNPV
jgi:hypothetical protein